MDKPICAVRTDAPKAYPGKGWLEVIADRSVVESSRLEQKRRGDEVCEAVRRVVMDACLAAGGTEGNPLGGWIRPGMRVFVLCNFVQQRRRNQTDDQELAKCTHGSVVKSVCEMALRALEGKGDVSFGNAPLQSTDWESVLRDTGAVEVVEYFARQGREVKAVDLRMLVRRRRAIGWNAEGEERDQLERCSTVEFGSRSKLTELMRISGDNSPRFRVMDYDPGRTEEYQSFERHAYVIHQEVLRSDVVISVPKLKTHEKVGITCGLKGFVGVVGHKDCLAHHRFGGPAQGGDEYPSNSIWRRAQSSLHDYVNKARGDGILRRLGMALDRNATRLLSRIGVIYGGAWEGNDTCWRMAFDLTRAVHYADRRGQLQSQRQRTHLCLIDGIIGGEGRGPLSPDPVRSGVLVFSDNVALADLAACLLMGFDPQRIPLVREGFQAVGGNPCNLNEALRWQVIEGGNIRRMSELKPAVGRSFRASPGWGRLNTDWVQEG